MQKLTIGPKSIQRWIPTSDFRRIVEMITMYRVRTTTVSNVVPILVTSILSTLAVNISKILVIYFYYQIHVLRVKTQFKEDYQCRINCVQILVCYSVNYTTRQNSTKFLNQKRDLTLPKDFDALNPNPCSEFTLYVRLLRNSILKVRKTRLFALFGVM